MSNAECAISFARAQIGKWYGWGKTGPDKYDCSGLIYAAYKSCGVKIGRWTGAQILNGSPVAKADLLPGDLVFPDPGHVQLYVGNGRIIEAAHTGTRIRETSLRAFWRARRVATPGSTTGAMQIQDALSVPTDAWVKSLIGEMAKDVFRPFLAWIFWTSEAGIGIALIVVGVYFILASLE